MADLKMPELNSVIVAGNLTKDPVFRETSNNTPVVNFHVAANRRYKDSSNQWQEDVCYVGVVAWNKLADSCRERLKKGSAVLIDGELQSRTFKTEDGKNRTIVEVKAKRIQFLNKFSKNSDTSTTNAASDSISSSESNSSYEENSFDKFLTDEESNLMNE
ncbi:MAG: single-stranded DNA-binding protein [Ignavibacteriae bacterium]|jgi:single-strand DNA-binding protein|nr:single-stranded DNA-binding protein [Ignavibacteriota bacterium]NOG96992.1 single-stranded DNA-binding protein [Ignavibacteriota bacterium]